MQTSLLELRASYWMVDHSKMLFSSPNLQVQVVHEKHTTLESLKNLVIILEVKLSSRINVDLYPTMANALSSSNKWHSKKLAPRSVASIFITNYFEDK